MRTRVFRCRAAVALPGLAAALALAGCSSDSTSQAVGSTPTATSAGLGFAAPSCPQAGQTAADWPEAVPDSLPKPPGAQIHQSHVVGAATYVYFTTPSSLRDSTLFVVRSLRAAGYTIARGDAEATESDAPFVGPTVVGAIRLTLTATCLTTWTLAVEPRLAATSGVTLIPHHMSATAKPLPFG